MDSVEDRRLLNPAFLGMLVLRASQGFVKEAEEGLPFAYAYVVAPFVLHPETREKLPQAVVTKLATWVERNGEITSQFPRRLGELSAATQSGMLTAVTSGLIVVGDTGRLIPNIPEGAVTKLEKQSSSQEFKECSKKAHFVGRWLATSGTMATVLTSLGVLT